MTVQSFSSIKERVLTATPKSKIAVFLVKRGGTKELDCVFDSIVSTQARIREKDPMYLGSFHSKSDLHAMQRHLTNSIK